MYNQEQIKAVIPHRDPFLFVDEITYLEPLKKAIGKLFVRESFDFFKGHFPQKPVMPGVLIVESLAQVGAFSLQAFFVGLRNRASNLKTVYTEQSQHHSLPYLYA